MKYEESTSSNRHAHCDICGQVRQIKVEDNGNFSLINSFGAHGPADGAPDFLPFRFVVSCKRCDLDICSDCVAWDTNIALAFPEIFGAKDLEAAKETASYTKLLKLEQELAKSGARMFTAVCPRCRGQVSSKSAADVERLQSLVPQIEQASRESRRQMAERCLRICQE